MRVDTGSRILDLNTNEVSGQAQDPAVFPSAERAYDAGLVTDIVLRLYKVDNSPFPYRIQNHDV